MLEASISWKKLTQKQKERLTRECLEELSEAVKNLPRNVLTAPQHFEQESLAPKEDFGRTDVEDIFEKAGEGCPKALKLIHGWARSGDLKAKAVLKELMFPKPKNTLPQSKLTEQLFGEYE